MKKRKILITNENIHQIAGRIRKFISKDSVYKVKGVPKYFGVKCIGFMKVINTECFMISIGEKRIFIIPGDRIYLDSNKMIITYKYTNTIELQKYGAIDIPFNNQEIPSSKVEKIMEKLIEYIGDELP